MDSLDKKREYTPLVNKFMPLIFESCTAQAKDLDFEKYRERREDYQGSHLFIFSHGLKGEANQFKFLKLVLKLAIPKCKVLSCISNEDKSDNDIFEMGKKLAFEVEEYIDSLMKKDPRFKLGRISFIGHSLGGLIIRAALQHLKFYKDKMHGLMTFATPHLGSIKHSNKMICSAMWVMKKATGSQALHQLGLTDQKNIEDTNLFKLCLTKGMNWFKHVILVSSHQDLYVPFDSARI